MMSPERARELFEFGETAISDAHIPGLSTWRRLQATYDTAVCAVAVLAESDVQNVTAEDEEHVLEQLLVRVQFDAAVDQGLRTLIAHRCTPRHLTHLVTDDDVARALEVVASLHSEARMRIAKNAAR